MIELKPCPFCGGKAKMKHGYSGGDAGFYVSCDCGVKTEVMACCYFPMDKAAKIWNSRAETIDPQELVIPPDEHYRCRRCRKDIVGSGYYCWYCGAHLYKGGFFDQMGEIEK